MQTFSASPESVAEFLEAVAYYADRDPAVAIGLIETFEAAIARIREFPEIGAPGAHVTRALLLGGFPYRIVYRFRNDEIRVVAVAHTSRRPGYWRGRR